MYFGILIHFFTKEGYGSPVKLLWTTSARLTLEGTLFSKLLNMVCTVDLLEHNSFAICTSAEISLRGAIFPIVLKIIGFFLKCQNPTNSQKYSVYT